MSQKHTPRAADESTRNAGTEPIYLSDHDSYQNLDLNRGSCHLWQEREPVSRFEVFKGRTAAILIFGQSNGANSGAEPYTPKRAVYNFNLFDGHCYIAKDPLLGCTESRGNAMTRMADMLVDRDVFDSVLLAPISVGGSRIEEWTPGGVRHRRLQVAIQRARERGIAFTHLLWHQGESNARADGDGPRYAACFRQIHAAVRRYGVTAPIFVAQATVCGSPPNDAIRAAQAEVVDSSMGIFAGPDTDTIGPADRFDDCHMTASGLVKHAEMWATVLARHQARS